MGVGTSGKRHRLPALVFVAALVLGAARLAQAGNPLLSDGPSPPTATSIVFATFFGEFLDGLRAVAPDFERETGIHVEVQGIPYMSYQMWLQARFLGHNPPDLLLLEGTNEAWRYGPTGLLVPFDEIVRRPNPFADDGRPWAESFREPYIQQSRDVNGRLYLIPFTQYGVGFFYNKDVYRALGLEPPATWEGLIRNLAAVQDRSINGRPAGEVAPFVTAIKPDDARTAWIANLVLECVTRSLIPQVNIRHETPDWRFDPYDRRCTLNERIDLSERIVAFERRIIDPAHAPEFAETCRIVKEMSRYWRPDFIGLAGGVEVDKVFAKADAIHDLNGTWYFMILDNIQGIMREVAPERAFDYGTFAFPELTPETTPLVRAGGINQNAGMRACFILPEQKDAPERVRAALRLCHYLTTPRVAEIVFRNTISYDIPALTAVAPKPKALPLLPKAEFAYLPPVSMPGYDNQAASEFWPLWQGFLGGQDSQEVFLDKLSRQHRTSLVRACRTYAKEYDAEFVRQELGHEFP